MSARCSSSARGEPRGGRGAARRHARSAPPGADGRAARGRRARRRAPMPPATPETSSGRPRTSARICTQAGFASSAPPVTTTSSTSAERLEDVGEAVADALERRLGDVAGGRREREARDDRPRRSASQPSERSPPKKRKEAEPVRRGRALGERRRVDLAQRLREPGVEVAAVGERAALAEAAARRGGRGRARAAARRTRRRRRPGSRPRCRPSARPGLAVVQPAPRFEQAPSPSAGQTPRDRLVRRRRRAGRHRRRPRRASPRPTRARFGSKSPVPVAVETLVRASPASRRSR